MLTNVGSHRCELLSSLVLPTSGEVQRTPVEHESIALIVSEAEIPLPKLADARLVPTSGAKNVNPIASIDASSLKLGDTKERSSKPRVAYRDIDREGREEPLRWVHVADPNDEVLDALAREFRIKRGDLNHCADSDCAPNSYRYGRYLVNRFVELAEPSVEQANVIGATILSVLGENFMVTVSGRGGRVIPRVWRELDEGIVPESEVSSSNHLFSRLFGSSLHQNSEAAHKLELACEEFSHRAAATGPTTEARQEYRRLKEVVLDATRALRNNLEVIHSLKEERNLFGSEAPRKALDRYEVIQDTISARLHHADEFLKIAQDDWRVTLNEHQNMILFRMALLSGALTPVALVSSLFGMNFPDGLPYSTVTMAAALIGSVITAGGLVAALLRKQPYPRGRNV